MDNPLLDFSGLPRFDAIRAEHVTPAIDSLLAEAEAAVRHAQTVSPVTWASFVTPLEDATERLWRAWGQVAHLQAVVDTPELREAYNANLPKLTRFGAALGQDLALFAQYRALAASPDYAQCDATRRKAVDNALRDFRLGGAELDDAGKARFAAIQEELSALSATFSQNVLDATDAFTLHVDDEARLSGLPADVVATARVTAEKAGKPGWTLTLKMPCYLPVQTYADDRGLREALYRASGVRASEHGPPTLDNSGHIDRILALRTELAALLGFASYADYSLATKMAQSPAEVLGFLRDLAARALPFARRDRTELEAFARDELGIDDLQPWDLAYASDKLKQARYGYSGQEVKRYLPSQRCLPACSTSSSPCMAFACARTVRRPGIPTCVSSGSKIPLAPCSASSTSTCTPATASAAARGWTTAATAGVLPPARRRPSSTWSAISARAWTASRRPSATMK